MQEMLTERYLQHLRDTTRFRYVENTPDEILQRVKDMCALLESKPPESESQRQYRERATQAATTASRSAQLRPQMGRRRGVSRRWTTGPVRRRRVTSRRDRCRSASAGRHGRPPLPTRCSARTCAAGVMKILFVAVQPRVRPQLRPDVLRGWPRAGISIHIAYQVLRNKMGENVMLEALLRDCPTVTAGPAAEPRGWLLACWPGPSAGCSTTPATSIRATTAPSPCGTRVKDAGAAVAGAAGHRVAWFGDAVAPAVHAAAALGRVARAAQPRRCRLRRRTAAGLLLVTPLVEPFSSQVDYVKEAARSRHPVSAVRRELGQPDEQGARPRAARSHVVVWNEASKREAVGLHGVPAIR